MLIQLSDHVTNNYLRFKPASYLIFLTNVTKIILQPAKKRSKTCILVKNLPAGTDSEEIKSLFARHGHIARFLMPKHGITALVDFIEPFEAKKAFTKLAYSQFKHTPLYLEWAPENVFTKSAEITEKGSKENSSEAMEINDDNTETSNFKGPKTNVKESKLQTQNTSKEKHMPEESKEASVAEEPENDTTLFVKNVNFRTTEDTLRSVST